MYIGNKKILTAIINGNYFLIEKMVSERSGTAGLTYSILSNGKVAMCTGIGKATKTDIMIASIYQGLPVKRVGDLSFQDNKNITSVTLPQSVEEITWAAFKNCDNLTTVWFGDRHKHIGNTAFAHCVKLTDIFLPDSLIYIDWGAFYNCQSLTSITIPRNVTSIISHAFGQCNGIKTVTFKGTPIQLYPSAFSLCYGIKDIYVPWAEGQIDGAPWGAQNATIHYNHVRG